MPDNDPNFEPAPAVTDIESGMVARGLDDVTTGTVVPLAADTVVAVDTDTGQELFTTIVQQQDPATEELLDPGAGTLDRDALLREMRRRRDAVEAENRAINDAEGAAFEAGVNAEIQAQETPPEEGAAEADKLIAAVDAAIRDVWGPLPWVRYTRPGRVLSVNKAARTCKVSIPEDGAPGQPDVSGVRTVRCGAGNPQVGKQYAVHFPFRLPDDPTALLTGPVPAGDPWLKAPSGSRWLYRQVNGPPLQRWAWPPPPPDSVWEPELVNAASVGTLLGGMTEAGQGTSIVTVDFEPATGFIRGSQNPSHPGGVPLRYQDHCYQYPGMGFEPQARDWRISPASVHVGAVANEGTALVGTDTTDAFLTLPPSVGYNTVLELAGHDVCCADDPGAGHGCVENFRYQWVSHAFEFVPLRYFGFNDAANIYSGEFGTMAARQAVKNTYTVLHIIDPTPDPVTIANAYPSGSCHWVFVGPIPVGVAFDSSETRIDSFPRLGGNSYVQTLAGRYNGLNYESTQLRFPFGAWGESAAGTVACLYRDQGIKANPLGPGTILDSHDQRLWLSVNGAPRDITIDPTGQVFIDPKLLAYDYEAGRPIVLAIKTDEHGEDSLQKWAGAWSPIVGADGVVAVSRDGVDMLGATRFGQQVYSVDGGATWAPCAQFPASTPTDLGLKFVDQLA